MELCVSVCDSSSNLNRAGFTTVNSINIPSRFHTKIPAAEMILFENAGENKFDHAAECNGPSFHQHIHSADVEDP